MSRTRPEEEKAREIVEATLGRQLVRRDAPGGPPGLHDFDMVERGRTIGALEVTGLADEQALGLDAAIHRHGEGIDTEMVARRWWIVLDRAAEGGPIRYTAIKDKLPPLVAAIEAEGREVFRAEDAWESVAVKSLFDALPVEMGTSWNDDKQPRILFLAPGRSAMVSGEVPHKAIEEAAAGERFAGERRKLSASGLPERHLFVWAHSTIFDVWSGVCEGDPPTRPLELPEEITTVWLAAMGATDIAPWRAERGDVWHLLR
jgi:hypothetical protein